jgi:hypothetical protein
MKDKISYIIVCIFWILCFIAFISFCLEFPEMLNGLFDTTIFKGSQTLFFFLFLFLLGYTLSYYQQKSEENKEKLKKDIINNLKNINPLDEFSDADDDDFIQLIKDKKNR